MNMETGTIIPGEGDGGENTAVDYEVEARKMGWTPKDEFKGDPNHHIDAETFYTRAVEFMPIAKATIKKLSNKIDQMEREQKKASEFFSKAEERAYSRALADIRTKQEDAVASGDLDAFRAADKEADDLRKEMGKPAGTPEVDEKERAASFGEWMEANPWYVMNEKLAAYTDAQAQIISTQKGGAILDRADLDALADKVKAKFPDAFDEGEPPKQKRSPVEGGGQRPAPRGGKTFADLPPEARAICDKWVKNKTIASREDYVKNYQW